MAILSAAQINAVEDAVIHTEPVPEWGGEVVIKGMTGTERDEFEKSIRPKGVLDLTNYRAKLLVRVLVNELGTRIYGDRDAMVLGKRAASVIERLYDIAARLSGLNDEAAEDAEGNSEAEPTDETPGSDSPSTSPETSGEPAQNS